MTFPAAICVVIILAGGVSRAWAADAPTPKIPSPSADMAPRDVLRRMIEPAVDVFSRDPQGSARAVSIQLHTLEATNEPPELRGARLRMYCQPPDKLFMQFFSLGTVMTFSRQGQSVWMTPASRLAPLLERVQTQRISHDDQEPLATLRLKVPTRLFWLMFRLAKIRDGGEDILNGQVCRRLEMDAQEKEDRGKSMRLWIRADTFRLVRVDWLSPTDHVYMAVDEFSLVPSLPASVFQPDAEAKADLLEVPTNRFRPLWTLLGKEEDKRKKAFHGAGN